MPFSAEQIGGGGGSRGEPRAPAPMPHRETSAPERNCTRACTLWAKIGILTPVPRAATLDADQVTLLVQTHQAGVWRYLRMLGATAELADDLTQEAFLQLLRGPFTAQGDAATAAWLRTVARNLYIKAHRHPPFAAAELDAIASAWQEFAADDAGERSLAALRSCLDRLDGRAREAVRLHYELRRSRDQIGAALAIGADGVKSLLRRTRALLRDCIERHRGQP